MKNKKLAIIAASLAVLSNIIIFIDAPLILRTLALIIIAAILPGAFLSQWVLGKSKNALELIEKLVCCIAMGYGAMIITMLLISYLPGAITKQHTLFGFNILLFALIAFLVIKPKKDTTVHLNDKKTPEINLKLLLVAVLLLLLIGGFVRFANLGYFELKSDEAKVLIKAAMVIQGREDTLFIYEKGPAEILISAAGYSALGRITEGSARVAFSFASLAAIFAVFCLGWRMFGAVGGFFAALLFAVDGYSIFNGRIVQYQCFVVLFGVIAVLTAWRALKEHEKRKKLLMLSVFMFACGALCHFDIMMIVPALGYVLFKVNQEDGFKKTITNIRLPVILAFAVVCVFYIPFILHPWFKNTVYYLIYKCAGITDNPPFNNIFSFLYKLLAHNAKYYFLLLSALTLSAFLITCHKIIKTRRALASGEKMLWLWLSALSVLVLFFIKRPGEHYYVLFVPWLLMAGMVVSWFWAGLKTHFGAHKAFLAIFAAAATNMIIITVPQCTALFSPEEAAKKYSFYQHGLKTIGVLYSKQVLTGGYDVNKLPPRLGAWYSRGMKRDRKNPEYIFSDPAYNLPLKQAQKYKLFACITDEHGILSYIYKKSDKKLLPIFLNRKNYKKAFDENLSGPFFAIDESDADLASKNL
ncbi:MAG: glycosyltransferase family 39 protein [Candidatus Omnitrophica bacterium]|nr:glycosyltransferase family 39 protein [Candidatus Omnitrophota bacterium]